MELWWLYAVWQQFYDKVYREALLEEHLLYKGKQHFYEVIFEITSEGKLVPRPVDQQSRQVVFLEKENKIYVLPAHFLDSFPLKVTKTIPCQIKESNKQIHYFVTDAKRMYVSETVDTNFRAFIDAWNPVEHSDPFTWTMLKLLAHGAQYKGVRLCLASTPSTGKGSNFILLNYCNKSNARVGSPTLARYESLLYHNNVVLIEEVTSMSETVLVELEQRWLLLGDNSPEYVKHSMAKDTRMDRFSIDKKSLIFPYNKPDNLNADKKFFDQKLTNIDAFRDRFPQVLLPDSKVLMSPPKMSIAQAREIMEKHFAQIADMNKRQQYWEHHLHEHLHNYDRGMLQGLPARQRSNLEGWVDAMDAYCSTQDEFDSCLIWLLNCLTSYKQLVGLAPVKVTQVTPVAPQVLIEHVRVGQKRLEEIEKELL